MNPNLSLLQATGTSTAITAPVLNIIDGQVTTTSNQVAANFGKQHKLVLRAIRNLLKDLPKGHERNFAPMLLEVEVGGGAVRKDPAYRLTRDGFALLAMGFTGKEALQWKVAYIDTFNKMEAVLLKQATIPAALYDKALSVETREAASLALAQSGSRAMLMRKKEKRGLIEELHLMREVLQLRLALGMTHSHAA